EPSALQDRGAGADRGHDGRPAGDRGGGDVARVADGRGYVRRPAHGRGNTGTRHRERRAAFRRKPLVPLPRLRLGRLGRTPELGSPEANRVRESHGWLSRAHRLSRIRFTGQKVAEPPKSSEPAANTFAPIGVS